MSCLIVAYFCIGFHQIEWPSSCDATPVLLSMRLCDSNHAPAASWTVRRVVCRWCWKTYNLCFWATVVPSWRAGATHRGAFDNFPCEMRSYMQVKPMSKDSKISFIFGSHKASWRLSHCKCESIQFNLIYITKSLHCEIIKEFEIPSCVLSYHHPISLNHIHRNFIALFCSCCSSQNDFS